MGLITDKHFKDILEDLTKFKIEMRLFLNLIFGTNLVGLEITERPIASRCSFITPLTSSPHFKLVTEMFRFDEP